MNTKLLKQKILDLAIHGKLVPQNPEDEPASVLLEKIRAEKEEKIQKGEIKRDKKDSYIFVDENGKHFEKFGDGSVVEIEKEIPFEIPNGWCWCRFHQLYQVINGDRGKNYPAKSTLTNIGIPFISALNIVNNSIREDENLLCLSDSQYELLGSGKLQLGDMVLCIRGSIGKHGRYPFEKGAIASSLVIIRNKIKLIEKLLDIYLETPLFYEELEKYDNGTTQPNLAADSLKHFLFPLPPLAEQQKIVDQIEKIFAQIDYIEQNQINLSTLVKQAKSKILDLAIHGKLVEQNPQEESATVLLEKIRAEKEAKIKAGELKRDKKDSHIFKDNNGKYFERFADGSLNEITDKEPFKLSNGWEWCMLDEITHKIKRGKTPKYTEKSSYFAFAQKCNLKEGGIALEKALYIDESSLGKYPPEEYMQENDIVINSTGTGTMGRVGIFNQKIPENIKGIFPDSHVTTVRCLDIINPLYIYHVIKNRQPVLEEGGEGSTNQKELKPQTIRELFIPLPPLKEQERIVDKINLLFKIFDSIVYNIK